jgi:hypothetical protein
MKKSVIILVAMLLAAITFGQKVKEKNVPEVIKTAFKVTYPNADDIKWEKEAANYEVEFELNDVDYSALYDSTGVLLETEMEIATTQLPQKALEYMNANYASKKIKEAAKITDAKGTVTYEAEIKGKDVIFDANGNFIKEIND